MKHMIFVQSMPNLETSRSMTSEKNYKLQFGFGKNIPFLPKLRYIRSNEDIGPLVQSLIGMVGDFTFSVSFSPNFVANVAKNGFLSMAIQVTDDFAVFAPKLHRKRCIMNFQDLCIPNDAIKRANDFRITVDHNFTFVCMENFVGSFLRLSRTFQSCFIVGV